MQNYNLKFKSDLKQRCFNFSLKLIDFLNKLSKNNTSYIIKNQLLRSGMSIGANLFEASASSSKLEFKRFNEISLKSANETKYWLFLLKESNISDSYKTQILLNEVTELSKMIASGVLKLKGKK
ncbi:MAG: four helix bundle protein [bacterium]